jgi:hypothetical protein
MKTVRGAGSWKGERPTRDRRFQTLRQASELDSVILWDEETEAR